VTTPFEGWVERVRAAMRAPSLARSEKSRPGADPKWVIGDVLLDIPEEHRDQVAVAAGLKQNDARSYWRTSEAWPPHTRTTPASWTVYRELRRMEDRFSIIYPGMKVRPAHFEKTGNEMDRRAQRKLDDDVVINEVVRLMLSPRSKAVVPQILDRLNASKEGRKAARDRRSGAALRRLDDEIRLLQKELRKRRTEKSAGLRFMELRRRLLDTEVNVEEVALLFNDPDDRDGTDEEEWRLIAQRLRELRDIADKVGTDIVTTLDIADVEAWDEADRWTVPGISVGGGGEIVDAEIVDED
jgi:hypothetical protein